MGDFAEYRKTATTTMRPYVDGEAMAGVCVSPEDKGNLSGGYIAKDKANPEDKWFVNAAYFAANYVLAAD